MHACKCVRSGHNVALTLADGLAQVHVLEERQQHFGTEPSTGMQTSSASQQQLQAQEVHIMRLEQQMLEMQGGSSRQSGYAHLLCMSRHHARLCATHCQLQNPI